MDEQHQGHRRGEPCCEGGREDQGPNQRGGPEGAEDHLDYTAGLWEKAFWQSLHEVRVEFLKERIRDAWGKGMKETSEAVLEAMLAEWKRFQEQEEQRSQTREEGPRERIKDYFRKALRKAPQ